jgi:predicted phosphodiesterase
VWLGRRENTKGGERLLSPRIPIIFDTPREFEYIQLLLASDMHNGSAQFDERKWSEFEKLIDDPHNYVVFCGDQLEYATKSSKSDCYEATRPSDQKRWWIEHLKGREDKIAAIIDGNHEFNRASKDADCFPLYDIALLLGIEDRYRSEAAFVDIGVGRRSNGFGGKERQNRYVGRLNHKAQNLVNYGTADSIEGIDFFVSGHTHKPMDKPLGKLVYDPQNKQVRERTVENIVCGHFLQYGGYGERGGMRVTSQKLYSLILDGRNKRIETRGFYV